MTLSKFQSGRFGVMALALVYTGLTFGAAVTPAPALAKASGPYYTAELAAPAGDERAVATGVAWRCEGTNCRAGKGTSRPLRICRGLHREFGEVLSFTANGKQLDESKLARCNGN